MDSSGKTNGICIWDKGSGLMGQEAVCVCVCVRENRKTSRPLEWRREDLGTEKGDPGLGCQQDL